MQTLNSMNIYGLIAVGLGATLGAWLRWLLSITLNASIPQLPLGTLIANLVGGYLMGICMAWIASAQQLSPELRLILTTGFLGGLTTFSTFSAEAVDMMHRGLYGNAGLHIACHVIGSLIMTMLGIWSFNLLR